MKINTPQATPKERCLAALHDLTLDRILDEGLGQAGASIADLARDAEMEEMDAKIEKAMSEIRELIDAPDVSGIPPIAGGLIWERLCQIQELYEASVAHTACAMVNALAVNPLARLA